MCSDKHLLWWSQRAYTHACRTAKPSAGTAAAAEGATGWRRSTDLRLLHLCCGCRHAGPLCRPSHRSWASAVRLSSPRARSLCRRGNAAVGHLRPQDERASTTGRGRLTPIKCVVRHRTPHGQVSCAHPQCWLVDTSVGSRQGSVAIMIYAEACRNLRQSQDLSCVRGES